MDWTGAAPRKTYGFALQGIPAMVVMEIGLEELELLKLVNSLSLLSPG